MRLVALLALWITFMMPLENYAQNAREYYTRAMVAKNNYEYKSAVDLLDKAVEKDPENARFFIERGKIEFGLSNDRRALDDLDKAVELEPENSWARIARGEVLLKSNLYDAAYADANMAYYTALSNKLRARSRLLRARVLRAEGKMGTAIAELEKGLAIDSNYVPGLQEMADILTQWGAFQQAENYLRACISRETDNPLLYCNLGYILAMEGKYKQALEYCNRSLDYDPSFPMALANRGYVQFKMNNLNLAMKDLKESLRNKRNNGTAWYFKSLVHLTRREKDKACKCLEKTLEYGTHPESLDDTRQLRKQFCSE